MFLTSRFYLMLGVVVIVTAMGYVWLPLYTLGRLLTLALVLAVLAETAALWLWRAISAERTCAERFSNGEVRDTVTRLCAESSDRIPKWLLPVIRDQLAALGVQVEDTPQGPRWELSR